MAVVPLPLVGRDPQLDLVASRLEAVRATTAAAMLLFRGEGGIGKSALLLAACARAEALGYRLVCAQPPAVRSGVPYALFDDAVARLDGADTAGLAAAFAEAVTPGGGDGPHRVRRAARALVAHLLRAGPLALVVDDLHTADSDSLTLLSQLLTDLADRPLTVLAAARPSGALAAISPEHVVDRLAVDGRGTVVDLPPLDGGEVAALLRGALRHEPDDRLVAEVRRQSRGNPFFALAALEELTGAGRVAVSDDVATVLPGPASPVESTGHAAVLRRFFRDPGAEARAARTLAAFDRFRLDQLPLLAELSGLPVPEVAAAFDRLVARGLVVEAEPGLYRFAHEIVRNALYDDIGPAERVRLHTAIAAHLETRGDLTLELAAQVAAAGGRDRRAAQVFLAAAAATDATAPVTAAGWYALAARCLPPGSPELAETLAQHAHALFVSGRQPDSAEPGLRALALLPAGALRTRTAGIVIDGLYVAGRVGDALRAIDEELARGTPDVPLLAQRVHYLGQAGRPAEAAAQLPAATAALAGVPGGNRVLGLTHLLYYEHQYGSPHQVTAHLAAIADGLDGLTPARRIAVLSNTALAAAFTGRLDEADTALRLGAALETFDIGGARATATAYLGWLRGEWRATLAHIRRSVFDLEHAGARLLVSALRAIEAAILAERGEHARAHRILDEVADLVSSPRPLLRLARAKAHRAAGDPSAALRLLTAPAADDDGGPVLNREWLLLELADLGAAADLSRLAGEFDTPTWWYCDARARAVTAQDPRAAVEAAELAGTAGLLFEAARSHLLAAELGDQPRRRLETAFETFDALGAAPWRRATAQRLRDAGHPAPRPGPVAADGAQLTELDLRLIELIAEGLTNQEIGRKLSYSAKTIEAYLSRLYRKMGCSSRIGLLRAAEQAGLLPPR
ncbi:AAA family ATPase [Dactylosporangium sp. AC04546]|uniref:AAA family ATPase n=1 Tax=Dactylosporangium sp. AC04546 TaxID=2862460 RepID=UPI0027147899|nr:AAA family ATPase [Dactylosporangium sp. AC04546]WVK88777.1 AAA family ATPase [Dactylosporangium sp. AC04546]